MLKTPSVKMLKTVGKRTRTSHQTPMNPNASCQLDKEAKEQKVTSHLITHKVAVLVGLVVDKTSAKTSSLSIYQASAFMKNNHSLDYSYCYPLPQNLVEPCTCSNNA